MDSRFYDHEKIARARIKNGITQKQLADLTDTKVMTIYRVENGLSCSPELLAEIAQHLGLSYKSLIKDNPLTKTFSLAA